MRPTLATAIAAPHTFQTFDLDGQPAALFEILRGDHTEPWLREVVPG